MESRTPATTMFHNAAKRTSKQKENEYKRWTEFRIYHLEDCKEENEKQRTPPNLNFVSSGPPEQGNIRR